MKKIEKLEKIQKVQDYLKKTIVRQGEVKNIGSVFFAYDLEDCVLRDVVYQASKEFEIPFEVLCMTSSYFVGSKKHAEILEEAYGGVASPAECCYFFNTPMEIYTWEGPGFRQIHLQSEGKEQTALDFEEIKSILF